MAVSYVDLTGTYTPQTTNTPIQLSVQFGDGQPGSYFVFIGATLTGTNQPTTLGTATALAGQKILVSATVVEALKETLWTSITITVTEGSHTQTFGPYSQQAANQLDTIIYSFQLTTTA